jgi:hypothetical protein
MLKLITHINHALQVRSKQYLVRDDKRNILVWIRMFVGDAFSTELSLYSFSQNCASNFFSLRAAAQVSAQRGQLKVVIKALRNERRLLPQVVPYLPPC